MARGTFLLLDQGRAEEAEGTVLRLKAGTSLESSRNREKPVAGAG